MLRDPEVCNIAGAMTSRRRAPDSSGTLRLCNYIGLMMQNTRSPRSVNNPSHLRPEIGCLSQPQGSISQSGLTDYNLEVQNMTFEGHSEKVPTYVQVTRHKVLNTP